LPRAVLVRGSSPTNLQRLEILHEIRPLLRRQGKTEEPHIVVDGFGEGRGPAVVEVRALELWGVPEPSERVVR
jgi:hypothetical protein